MTSTRSFRLTQRKSRWRMPLAAAATLIATSSVLAATAAGASADGRGGGYGGGQGNGFQPGNLLVSGSYYVGQPGLLTPGVTVLPPDCTSGCATAVADGSYPGVWNNDAADGSFGITSPIFLDQLTPDGHLVSVTRVPSGWFGRGDYMSTSFSSKSELALNLSTDHKYVTFMGYLAKPNTLDASNANTPGVVDPTNPVGTSVYRVVAQMDQQGHFKFTLTNAYSGNNGRAAILNDSNGNDVIYTAGNAGNGSNPQPDGVIIGTGAQIMNAARQPEAEQNPGTPTPVGSFNVTQLGDKSDKIGKDTNFRGLTEYDNVLYFTKGSGSNGINTVYFLDTTGKACPDGVGVPQPGAQLPTTPLNYNTSPTVIQADGLTPYNMCVLQGFPTTLAKTSTAFPFGMWFANPDTLYVADEGNGTDTYDPTTNTYTAAADQTTAGLQKWVFNGTSWQLAYTLSSGLNLGTPYTVPGYPAGDNAATGLPWAPAADGLRNITGRVNQNGTVTIWAVTSTVSGNGDQGADPNQLVSITDKLGATTLPASEQFNVLRTAGYREVLRGVSFTPGTGARNH